MLASHNTIWAPYLCHRAVTGQATEGRKPLTQRPWPHDCFGRYALSCHGQALLVKCLLSLHRPMSAPLTSRPCDAELLFGSVRKAAQEVLAQRQNQQGRPFQVCYNFLQKDLSMRVLVSFGLQP